MRLVVKNRFDAELDNTISDPHVIVSISTPEDKPANPATNSHTLAVLGLVFDDLDREPQAGSATFFVLHNPVLFDRTMARQIVDLIIEYDPPAVLAHCDAGQSRSAGVAAALAKHFNGDDSEFFGGPSCYGSRRYTPNMRVYRLLLNEFVEAWTEEGEG